MSQQAQFDLRVVGGEQLRAGGGGEGGANLAAQLGAGGNVLQIWIDGGEAAGGCCGLPERWCGRANRRQASSGNASE